MTHQEKAKNIRIQMTQTRLKMDKMQQDRMLNAGFYFLLIGGGFLLYAFTGSFSLALGFCFITTGVSVLRTVNNVQKLEAEEKAQDTP